MKYRVLALAVAGLTLSTISAQYTQASPKSTRNVKTTLTVFAASSLGETFESLGKQFEREHPGVRVLFSFLASSTLATQLLAGAPADIFAAASESDMARVEGHIFEPVPFASNRVVLATPKGNNFGISKIADLNRSSVKWIQCAHTIPCGMAADIALSFENRLKTHPVSLEPKVSSVVAKLVAKEVDAAIIYHTDFLANRATLREIPFKNRRASTTRYFIGAVKEGGQASLSKSFIQSVLSADGRRVLSRAGFTLVK